MLAILAAHLPVPAKLLEEGITPNEYYTNISYWVGPYRQEFPAKFTDLDLSYDAVVMTKDLEERVVEPTLAAGQMFRSNRYMTRLFTTLSPEEMTRDPVFSFNPSLPDVLNVHEGRLVFWCGANGQDINTTPAVIYTAQGWRIAMPFGTGNGLWPGLKLPASLRTEILREEGAPQTVKDNSDAIATQIGKDDDDGGCRIATGGAHGRSYLVALAMLALVVIRRRRA
jgi:MYXO-CTERM domain-containing protein